MTQVADRPQTGETIGTDVVSRVACGAADLDRIWGKGWEYEINCWLLDIGDGERCIIGQLYGDYYDVFDNEDESFDYAARHGFIGIGDTDMDATLDNFLLTSRWCRVIHERRGIGG